MEKESVRSAERREERPVGSTGTRMQVRKRNGSLEPVDLNKIVLSIQRPSEGLPRVDAMRVATRTVSGLYDGATTRELDQLSIQTAASLVTEEPEYGKLAARLLSTYVDKEVRNQDIMSFSQSIARGKDVGLIGERVAKFVADNARKLNDAVDPERTRLFEYFGLRTLYDRYLLKHPERRDVLETPQYFFLRIACALSENVAEAIDLYRLFSTLEYLPSSPTLFNSGTRHEQLSSCFLLDSPEDDLGAIYKRYADVAMLSKFSGGIGLAYHRVRSRGSLIKSTNGQSNGIVPWLRTLDSSVAAVNQGGKRKGAACVYLETWHADIEEFLELRDNTGDEARRTHNLNLANWVPDLFMKRVEADEDWTLFDPKRAPHLTDLWGADFDAAYTKAEADGLGSRTVKARELYGRMMRTLAQTGNGWMTFKDKPQPRVQPDGEEGRTWCTCRTSARRSSRSPTQGETAVCNLGSINLGRHLREVGPAIDTADALARFDWEKLGRTVRTAVRQLDRVIDLNFYPTPEAAASNARWRPVGLGLMGLQDVFFQLRLAVRQRAGAAPVAAHLGGDLLLGARDERRDRRREGPAPLVPRDARGSG
jgi:ribonucleoside-diphosphate reductase alpha chain